MIDRIGDLLQHDKAGDPVHGLKWTRKTTRNIACQLRKVGIRVSATTVGRLMKDMGFSLRVNQKTLESGNKNPPSRRIRNRQFKYITTVPVSVTFGCCSLQAETEHKLLRSARETPAKRENVNRGRF